MNLQSLVDLATRKENATVAVAAAEDKEVLKAVSMAVEHGMAEFLLFGDREKIEQVMEESQRDLLESARIKIIHSPSVQNAAELAVQAVNKKKQTF